MRQDPAAALQGTRAGLISRAIANAIDMVVVLGLGSSILLAFAFLRWLLTGSFVVPDRPDWFTIVGGPALAISYLALGWATTGRTVGKQVMGLRLITHRGGTCGPLKAIARSTLCVLVPIQFLWVAISRSNASVVDLLLGTVVIYDWRHRSPRSQLSAAGPAA